MHLLQERWEIFSFIKEQMNNFPIEKMCKVLSVSKSGFYSWLNHRLSKRELENIKILDKIKELHIMSRYTYGSPRITECLNAIGINISRQRVARIMRNNNIRSITKKKYIVTTNSKHSYKVSDNLLQRNFHVDIPGKVWVSDITYIKTNQGWLYLTVIIDLFDRKVIGWALSKSMHADVTSIAALKMALINRLTSSPLIFHSDRGIQYACDDFRKLLKTEKIIQSMSRKGNCWDNAVAESFFKSIKTECIYHHKFKTREMAERFIFEYIEVWYNRQRMHSSLNYATPLEFDNYYFINVA